MAMWQPIETAPKTGKWIHVRSDDDGLEWHVRWDGRNDGWFTSGNNRLKGLTEWLPEETTTADELVGWRPIETAPKDGTKIVIVACENRSAPPAFDIARWREKETYDDVESHGRPEAWESGWYTAGDFVLILKADYWLPLDALPPLPEIKPDPIATDDDLIARLMKIVGCTSPQSSFESWLKGYAAGTKKLADLNSSNNPEFDATDGAHPAWWRGHDHGAQSICREVEKILDRKKDAFGACAEPWNTIRKRLLGLLAVVECRESAKADDGVLIADELRKRITEIRDRMTVVEGRLTDIKTLNFHAGRTSGVQLVLNTIFPAADEPKQASGE